MDSLGSRHQAGFRSTEASWGLTLGKEKRRKQDWARELSDQEADLIEVKSLTVQRGATEGWRVDCSLEEWKKPALVQLLCQVPDRDQPKKSVTDLGLKAGVDSRGAHSWRLAANHAPQG